MSSLSSCVPEQVNKVTFDVNDRTHSFKLPDGSERLLARVLEGAGISGTFKLNVGPRVRGNAKHLEKGLHVVRYTENSVEVRVAPFSKGDCARVFLIMQRGIKPVDVFQALRSYEESAPDIAPVVAVAGPVAAPDPAPEALPRTLPHVVVAVSEAPALGLQHQLQEGQQRLDALLAERAEVEARMQEGLSVIAQYAIRAEEHRAGLLALERSIEAEHAKLSSEREHLDELMLRLDSPEVQNALSALQTLRAFLA